MFCSELKRHLKTKHPEAYKKVEITDRKSLKLQRESVNEGKRIQQQIVDLKEKFEKELDELMKSGKETDLGEDENLLYEEENVDDDEFLRHLLLIEYSKGSSDENHEEKVQRVIKYQSIKAWKEKIQQEFVESSRTEDMKTKSKWSSNCKRCETSFQHRGISDLKYHLFDAHLEVYETITKDVEDSMTRIKEVLGKFSKDDLKNRNMQDYTKERSFSSTSINYSQNIYHK